MKDYEVIMKYKVQADSEEEALQILVKYRTNTGFYMTQEILRNPVVKLTDVDIKEIKK